MLVIEVVHVIGFKNKVKLSRPFLLQRHNRHLQEKKKRFLWIVTLEVRKMWSKKQNDL